MHEKLYFILYLIYVNNKTLSIRWQKVCPLC